MNILESSIELVKQELLISVAVVFIHLMPNHKRILYHGQLEPTNSPYFG